MKRAMCYKTCEVDKNIRHLKSTILEFKRRADKENMRDSVIAFDMVLEEIEEVFA